MWAHRSASNSSNDSNILFIPSRGAAHIVKDLEKLYFGEVEVEMREGVDSI